MVHVKAKARQSEGKAGLKHDLTTVRSLVKSVTPLARHLGVTNNAVYRYIRMNKIPGSKVIQIANFYDLELADLLPLTQSDIKSPSTRAKEKPRDTLPTLIQVLDETLTREEAAAKIGIHPNSVSSILAQWGDELRTLHMILEEVEQGHLTIVQAAERLGIGRVSMNSLRIKYGYRPEKTSTPKPERPIVGRRKEVRATALAAIAGKITLTAKDAELPCSWRTIHRAIKAMSPNDGLVKLTHWPLSLRQAYATELASGETLPRSPFLFDSAVKLGLLIDKTPKPPLKMTNFREMTARQLLIQVLYGYVTVPEVAELRGADPTILGEMFNREVMNFGVTWNWVSNASVAMQIAIADLLQMAENMTKTTRQKQMETLKLKKALASGEL